MVVWYKILGTVVNKKIEQRISIAEMRIFMWISRVIREYRIINMQGINYN